MLRNGPDMLEGAWRWLQVGVGSGPVEQWDYQAAKRADVQMRP